DGTLIVIVRPVHLGFAAISMKGAHRILHHAPVFAERDFERLAHMSTLWIGDGGGANNAGTRVSRAHLSDVGAGAICRPGKYVNTQVTGLNATRLIGLDLALAMIARVADRS